MLDVVIREYREEDWPRVWRIVEAVTRAGETYPYPVDMDEAAGHKAWIETPARTYVAERAGDIIGTYYIKPNQPALGAHVCNCGYMVAASGRGQGIGRRLCAHSLEVAPQMGFLAMQYNLVVATNERAVSLWQAMGFSIVGRLPRAFRHQRLGLVDALVMYRWLGDPA